MHENAGFFCAPPSPGTHRRQVSLAVLLEIDECNISQPCGVARAKTHIRSTATGETPE